MRRSPVLLFLLLTSPLLFGQGEVYDAIKKLEVSDSVKMVKIDSLLADNLNQGNLKDLEAVSGRYANWLYKRRKIDKALTYLQLNIDHHTGDSVKLQKQLYKAGQFAFKIFDYNRSAHYFKQAVAVDAKNLTAGKAYIELGRNYYFLGDYYRSIEYFELGESLLTELENYDQLARGYINSNDAYRALKTDATLTKLYSNLRACDSLIEEYDLNINKRYLIQRAMGLYYNINLERKDTIKGLAAFERSLDVAFEMKDSLKISHIYMDMGNLFDVHNFEKSNGYFGQADRYCPKRFPNDRAVIKSNVGSNLVKMGEFETGINSMIEALHLIIGENVDFSALSDSEKEKILNKYSTERNFWIIMSWVAEGYLLQYEKEEKTESMEKAIFYFKLTDEIFDIYTQNVNTFSSKLQWRKDATKHYGRALKACYYAQDMETAFFFMEKNKAILLTEAIDKQRTNRSFNLPAVIYKRESELKHSILQLEKQIALNGTNVSTSEELLRKKERLSTYWDSISNLYPSYVPLKNFKVLSVKDVQKKLEPEEVMISYHLAVDDGEGVYSNTNNGYVMAITPNQMFLEEIPSLEQLRDRTRTITEALKEPFKTEEEATNYYKTSNQLYLELFPSEAIRNLIKGKKATIIADNYLSMLPFEALSLKADAPYYLIQESEIHYLYSNSFLENNRKQVLAENSFLGMAPTNFENKELPTLTYSSLEIENLQNYYSGSSFYNELATKDSFMTQLPDYGIIHLATHANAQDSIAPWIAFYDGKIMLEDLYQTQNNASLVVLSGCNTTLGEQAVGEGVMSLARGFFYSGAQSVMSTLWSIDDRSTSEITKLFYENLDKGQKKSEALHNAKLSYINSNSLSEASPYYWASFIMLGENDTLEGDTRIWPYALVTGLLLGTVLIIRRQRKKPKNS
ncbi:MAG: CHAT domain-containing protein [Bacteroidota bacterium]